MTRVMIELCDKGLGSCTGGLSIGRWDCGFGMRGIAKVEESERLSSFARSQCAGSYSKVTDQNFGSRGGGP